MKTKRHLSGRASWKSRTKKEKAEHIKRMNEARIKTMEQNKRDAEEYRKIKFAELDKNAINRVL